MRKPTKKREAAREAIKDMVGVCNIGRDTKPNKHGYCMESRTYYNDKWDVQPSTLDIPLTTKLDALLGLDTEEGINQWYKQ